jgi:hypothetical protein
MNKKKDLIKILIDGKEYFIIAENFSYIQKLIDKEILIPVMEDYALF